MLSIQTNVDSLIAQENLNVNNTFQSQTIQQLTSGYRINQAGDDAAGLAVANQFRNSVAQLTQGVSNGNDAVAQLQIMDGGMSNISQILDRLQTLATESASGTFTGDRNTLNAEFQADLGEIDRQAQSIGLQQGGVFAKDLSVYLGMGSGSTTQANALVNVDLSQAEVDSQSLGLTGMQMAGTTDIGPGAGAHSVANIVATSTGNQTSAGGNTVFYFSGAGFSGANKIAVSVDPATLTDVSSLATALNTAIQNAANGSTQAAAAFKSANIVASVHTDSNGGEELAFTSSTAAFQVEAGDQMANALLGNFQSPTSSLGTAIASTVTGGATTSATAFTASTNGAAVQISGGGLDSPVNLALTGSTVAGVVSNLQASIASNAALQAAGITVGLNNAGTAVVFSSSSGESLNVAVTGDTTGALGYGEFAQAASNTSADYTSITGAAYVPTTATGTSGLQFSFGGASGIAASVNLTQGQTPTTVTGTVNTDQGSDPTAVGTLLINGHDVGLQAGDTTMELVAQRINLATGTTNVTASVNSSNELVLTSTTPGAGGAIALTGSNGNAEVTALFGATPTVVQGSSATAANVAQQLNADFANNTTLAAAGLKATAGGNNITIASTNGTYFRVGATTAATTDIGFGANATAAAYTAPTATASNTSNDAGGVSSFTDVNGGTNTTGFSFTGLTYGNESQALTFSANNPSSGTAQALTITLQNNGTNRSGANIDSAISYINQQLQQSNNATLQQIVAVKENDGGTEMINFISPLPSFSVGIGSTSDTQGINYLASGNYTQSGTYTSTLNGAASNIAIDTQAGAQAAVTAVSSAVSLLGSAQAAVGIGENRLNYAVNLAQSQIINFSAAESQIRDANIATEAANLSKAQVLQQSTIAAMAQANAEPQAVLALLRTT